jgi:ribonuclease Z
MSRRELVVLGTAAQAPTRRRNHNGYLLRWDDEGLLLDPGEGTQRQMLHAGLRSSQITRVCISHFHGDHCLGLPGVLMRRSLDDIADPIDVHYPAEGEIYYQRLRHVSAAATEDGPHVRAHPCTDGTMFDGPGFRLTARRLVHRVPTLGWRLEEPDGRRMLPERLAAVGVVGPDIGRLQRDGQLDLNGRRIALEEVSAPRPGQRFAFIMDTEVCQAAFELAQGADLVVCESTFLSVDEPLARRYQHLTAAQAARIAAEAGARRLVLTHFSQRYADPRAFLEEASAIFDDVVVAEDLDRVPVPQRVQVEA